MPPRPVAHPPKDADTSLSSIIDTIEAIIIALIIALTFRAFIVEAFVIPTGSMAPTLLGAHFKVICPKCGYEFDRDASLRYQARGDGRTVVIEDRGNRAELGANWLVPMLPTDDTSIVCPNCRYPINPSELPQYLDEKDAGYARPVPFVWANNGDRILVLKYLYSVSSPQRWDVIVFKEPQQAQDNYIKRLIGLPGETIQIINGDIYCQEPGSPTREIQRKPEYLQQSLWQLVYDNDFYPTDEGAIRRAPFIGAWTNPWRSTSPDWKKGPTMAYSGKGPSQLVFNVRPAYAQESPYTLNTLGYNNDFNKGETDPPRSLVGDLRLETLWMPAAGEPNPSITMTLGRPNNCYRVQWNGAGKPGLQLYHYNLESRSFETVDGPVDVAPPEPGHSYRLALNNVDRTVQFFLDGRKVISLVERWDAAQAIDDLRKHPPDMDSPDMIIDIGVSGPSALAHVKLFRDLYYTDAHWLTTDRPPGTGTQNNPVTLGPDEFFALGDNSRRSSDGRMWSTVYPALGDLGIRPGIVPRRYLLGKAFFVYWPAGYRPTTELPVLDHIPIVPNTGDMRVIR